MKSHPDHFLCSSVKNTCYITEEKHICYLFIYSFVCLQKIKRPVYSLVLFQLFKWIYKYESVHFQAFLPPPRRRCFHPVSLLVGWFVCVFVSNIKQKLLHRPGGRVWYVSGRTHYIIVWIQIRGQNNLWILIQYKGIVGLKTSLMPSESTGRQAGKWQTGKPTNQLVGWLQSYKGHRQRLLFSVPYVSQICHWGREWDRRRQFYLWREAAGTSGPRGPTGQVWSHHGSNVSPLNTSWLENRWVDLLRKIL